MSVIRITPLDRWIRNRIRYEAEGAFTREALRSFQLLRLRDCLVYATRRSPFYRRQVSKCTCPATIDFEGLAALPFTTAEDLVRDPLELLCISQAEVARVVTIRSSGTTGRAKRLYFGPKDLERTIDFFHHGMSTLVQAGQRVLILMPGGLPGSVGDLLVEGLARLGAEGIAHGPVQDPEAAIAEVLRHGAGCLVGVPVQVLSLARHPRSGQIPRGLIHSVLLSADYVPESVVTELKDAWGCRVYQHYGMTEMGYGGGIECDAHDGYHLREADLLVEIIDPATGRVLPDGVSGEVVVTTLTRRAMPLIRYRTGDMARVVPEYCPCGSVLRRLGKVQGRLAGGAALGPLGRLHMAALDEAVFAVPMVLNFQAELIRSNGSSRLRLTVHCDPGRFPETLSGVRAALDRVPVIREAVTTGILDIEPIRMSPENWISTGSAKRTLIDRTQEKSTP
jgi:phenylacetate-CoA ligase